MSDVLNADEMRELDQAFAQEYGTTGTRDVYSMWHRVMRSHEQLRAERDAAQAELVEKMDAAAAALAEANDHRERLRGERDEAREIVEHLRGERDEAREIVEHLRGERDEAREIVEHLRLHGADWLVEKTDALVAAAEARLAAADQAVESLKETLDLAVTCVDGDHWYAQNAGLDADAIFARAHRALAAVDGTAGQG